VSSGLRQAPLLLPINPAAGLAAGCEWQTAAKRLVQDKELFWGLRSGLRKHHHCFPINWTTFLAVSSALAACADEPDSIDPGTDWFLLVPDSICWSSTSYKLF
jgi:hypothetical protein